MKSLPLDTRRLGCFIAIARGPTPPGPSLRACLRIVSALTSVDLL
ncbi:hypothetical protein [Myxococcus fulvus]|nr:hypothetical protein [Myxococcus fulvus]